MASETARKAASFALAVLLTLGTCASLGKAASSGDFVVTSLLITATRASQFASPTLGVSNATALTNPASQDHVYEASFNNYEFVCLHCNLPGGVEFSPSTGRIYGVPILEGNFTNITVYATPLDHSTAEFSLVLNLTLQVNSPQDTTSIPLDTDFPVLYIGEAISFVSTKLASHPVIGQYFNAPPPSGGESDDDDDGNSRRRRTTDVEVPLFFVEGQLPRGLSLDPLTGRISGTPTQQLAPTNLTISATLTGEVFYIVRISVTVVVADCSVDTNGPNGQPCFNNGKCVDATRGDATFTCSCPADLSGANCEEVASSSSSSGLSNSSRIALGVGASIAIIALLAVAVVVCMNFDKNKVADGGDLLFTPPEPDVWEFPRSDLAVTGALGKGEFGVVSRGEALNIRGQPGVTQVAVKQCDQPDDTSLAVSCKKRFVAEGQVMKRFNHANVLRLLGVCFQEEPLYIISEFMRHGDLRTFLREHRDVDVNWLVHMASDIASGVAYLHGLQYVHGDLACRNCLVSHELTVKISDFGLSKDTAYKGYYLRNLSENVPLPVRWMAPETIRYGQYTAQSDMWSLAIVFCELFTHGEMPYPAMGNQEVYLKVVNGYRMDLPSLAPPEMRALIQHCWHKASASRPSAARVHETLLQLCNLHESLVLPPSLRSASRPNPRASVNTISTASRDRNSIVPASYALAIQPNGYRDISRDSGSAFYADAAVASESRDTVRKSSSLAGMQEGEEERGDVLASSTVQAGGRKTMGSRRTREDNARAQRVTATNPGGGSSNTRSQTSARSAKVDLSNNKIPNHRSSTSNSTITPSTTTSATSSKATAAGGGNSVGRADDGRWAGGGGRQREGSRATGAGSPMAESDNGGNDEKREYVPMTQQRLESLGRAMPMAYDTLQLQDMEFGGTRESVTDPTTAAQIGNKSLDVGQSTYVPLNQQQQQQQHSDAHAATQGMATNPLYAPVD